MARSCGSARGAPPASSRRTRPSPSPSRRPRWRRDRGPLGGRDFTQPELADYVAGRLREERLRIGGPPSAVELGAGDSFGFKATDVHRVVHPGGEPAVSIHAYSPPLRGMGSYVIEPLGAQRRHALGRDVELRTLASTPLVG